MNSWSRRVRLVALAVVVVMGVSSCSSLLSEDTDNGGGDTKIARFRIPVTKALKPFYDQGIQWQSCGPPYECAYVYAPLDWNKPGGKQIRLALIKHPASGEKIGSLLVDPGGPGASGVDLVGAGVENAVDAAVAKRYDVIGFDPRGVGESTAVNCGGNAGLDRYLYGTVQGQIGSSRWIAGEKAKSLAFAKACKRGTGALLTHLDTINAARDMDIVRAALGEKKLNYLGYSYGTYLGTMYAGLYPKHVGRLVFDGPENPWFGSDGGSDSQAASFDSSLDAYLRSCLRGSSRAVGKATCPFTGTFSQAAKSVKSMLNAAQAHPIRNADGRRLNAFTLATAISDPLYAESEWPRLTTMFTQVRAGSARAAFELADEYNDRDSDGKYEDNLAQASIAINCLEDGSSIDLHYDADELKQLKKSAPILGVYQGYGDLGCYGWKGGPSPFPDPIHATGAGPILLVGTTGDPATPYSGAKALAKQLDRGHLVTYHGQGHTAYDEGNACVDRAVDEYLIDGVVPSKDPNCR